MIYSLISTLVLLLLAAESGFSQIGYPGGQYPGGQYPGGGYPGGGGIGFPMPGGGRRTRTNQDQAPTQNFTGTLRRISTSELVLESDDKRSMTIELFSSTRYYKSQSDADSGDRPPSTAKRADFQPGDQLSVDASQDDNGNYRAAKVALVKAASAKDHERASGPVDSSSPSSRSSSSDSGDDDRPKLHRAAQPSSSDSSSTPSSTQSASTDDSTSSSSASNRPATSRTPQPPPLDADDAGAPTLQRGKPTARSSSSRPASTDSDPVTVADARPSLHAEDVNGVTRVPDAPRLDPNASPARAARLNGDEDPVIEKAREAAFSFSETLPNYVVKQVTTRFATESARGGHTSWQAIDTVTADVVSEEGKESYKNVLVNGHAPREAVEKTGAWSTGEFSSLLQDVLSDDTDADFRNKRSSTIANRSAFRYDFSVRQPNSHWHVYAMSESYSPAYDGTIWIDKETYRALRVELSAQKIPQGFPLDTVESAVDYDFVLIGDGKYLLPVHSEALSCRRGTGDCTRNVIDFRNYKKFGAETSITFGADK